jgi:hypothetical protein
LGVTEVTTDEFLSIYEDRLTDKVAFVHEEVALCRLLQMGDRLKCIPELDRDFHKLFRKIDTYPNPEVAQAVWALLNDAPVFWALFTEKFE